MRSLNWPNLMTSGVTGHLVTRAYEEYCGGMSIHKPKFFNDSNDAFDYWVGHVGNDMYSLDTLLADAESLKNGLPNIIPTINDDDDACRVIVIHTFKSLTSSVIRRPMTRRT